MAVVHLQQATAPTLFVTKGRQRVKQYGNVIYLRNGDEFELELFNPKTFKVLAKISLNGKSLGAGLVLRPGERVFLERYLDEAKKFLFETYEINGADAAAKAAVIKNGEVEVEFFEEYHQPPPVYFPPTIYTSYYTNTGSGLLGGSSIFTTNTTNIGGSLSRETKSKSKGISSSRGMSAGVSSSCSNDYENFGQTLDFAPEETGRVEKGSNSDQDFNYDSTQFNSYSSWRTNWKILPESQRTYLKEDIKVFCTACGAKRKKSSHVFCPNCGNRF